MGTAPVGEPFVLLPPSESKAPGGDGAAYDPTAGSFGALAAGRRKVSQGLRRRDFDATAHLGVKGTALAAAMRSNRALATARTLPALRRYTGVLYDALAYAERSSALRRQLDVQVLVVSGLLGLVRGDDPVPPYKVPIGAALPGLGRLATFWRPRLIAPLATALGTSVVWDLLPAAHASAVTIPAGVTCWRVLVQRECAGRRSTVSHENKTVKGALAAAVIAGAFEHPDRLASWVGPGGYRLREVSWNQQGGTLALVTAT
ncbi:MAG TPA: peroxide stress protein YaaA [Mycobacteriales bacterium]|nr:peroxide stress protein YaaA [Mycobacteriales bacterium]